MGKRGDRFRLRAVKQKEARATNGPRKAAERARRETRMFNLLSSAKPPYSRLMRNWLADKLSKPEVHITADDVKQLLAAR
jgi:hypothetical protein